MLKQSKVFFLISVAVIAIVFLQSCKKHDVFPSQQLPQLISVNPSAAKVGDTVVIKGANLKSIADVKFGTLEADKFNSNANTDTAIRVVVPATLLPGDLYVQVYLSNGKGYAATKFTVLETPKVPDITSVNPATAFPSDNITLRGINF